MKFQSTKTFDGFSAVFRQWRAFHSHCRFLHGYSLSFKVWFEGELDCRNWVQDYGSFKSNGIKKTLDYWFDHTTLVAVDDPHLKSLRFLGKDQVAQLRIVVAVGAERFAELAFVLLDAAVRKESNDRVRVVRVECFEHSKNSAICEDIVGTYLRVKYCAQCGVWKLGGDFHSLHSSCKSCEKEQYRTNPELRQKALESAQKRYREKREEVLAIGRKWLETNRDRHNLQARIARKKIYRTAIGKLTHNVRSMVHAMIVKQETFRHGRTKELLGCNWDQLKLHLESQFKPGMTWDNYGEWHIDHIRPCASFDLSDPTQQFECFHYTNLQPLWAKENVSKGSLYEGERHFHKY